MPGILFLHRHQSLHKSSIEEIFLKHFTNKVLIENAYFSLCEQSKQA